MKTRPSRQNTATCTPLAAVTATQLCPGACGGRSGPERATAHRNLSSRMMDALNVGLDVPLDRPGQRSSHRVRVIGTGLAWFSGVIGGAVLMGYVLRQERIVEIAPSLPPMYPNAALALVAGAVAVVGTQWKRRTSRAVAAAASWVVFAIGGIGLVLNLAEVDRTWFEALFPAGFVVPTTSVGGRPVIETCLAFVLLGSCFGLISARRAPVVGQVLAFAAAALGFTAIVGFALGVDRRAVGSGLYVGMALHTAVGITALALAAIMVPRPVGIVALLLDGGGTGTMSRRLSAAALASLLFILVTGLLIYRFLPTRPLAQSVFSVLQVATIGALVLLPSAVFVRTERELRARLDASRRRTEDAADVDTIVESITAEMAISAPAVPGWTIGIRYEPAWGHLAGDSLQILDAVVPEGSTLLVLFDIAGHDAHAALVAYGLRTHIAALWERGASLSEIAASANQKLLSRGTIGTAVLMAFPHDGATVEVLNAGHPPPFHFHSRTPSRWAATGPLLGLAGADQSVHTTPVDTGDLIVMCTDGLEEARAPDRSPLGDERLLDLVAACAHEPPQRVANALVDAALEHSGGRLGDDALVVVLRKEERA